MAPILFPASLPPPLTGTLVEGLLETKVQDQSEVGAPRRRNRFTRTLERFGFSLLLSNAQKQTLYDFYQNDLERGVEAFNWTHPDTGVVYLVVFPSRPGAKHLTNGYWTIDIELEEI